MKGRKPLYSVFAYEGHVRPRNITALSLWRFFPAAFISAIHGQTKYYNDQHQQKTANAN